MYELLSNVAKVIGTYAYYQLITSLLVLLPENLIFCVNLLLN